MADPIDNVTVDTLHQSITDAIKAQFPALATVEFYREDRKGLTVPACLLNLTEMENAPDEDPGTGQLAMDCRFEAEIILNFRTPSVKLVVRQMAAAMAAWLRLRHWPGVIGGPAHVIGCYKDDFQAELDQYEVWRVEWHQVVHIGPLEADDGVIPQQLLGSWVPDIGLGHESKYVPIDTTTAPQVPQGVTP